MKNYLRLSTMFLFIFATAIFTSSCSKEDSTDSKSSTGKVTATIDGVAFSSTFCTGFLEKDTDEETQSLAIISEGVNENELTLIIGEDLNANGMTLGSYSASSLSFIVAINDETYLGTKGELILTESNSSTNTVSGTFTFKGIEFTTQKEIVITNGVFENCKYQN